MTLTVALALLPPDIIPVPLHANVAPGVVEDPFTVAVFPLQVMVPPVTANASGGVVLLVTVVIDVFTQPLLGSVTVTVYAPAALATSFCEEEVNPPGPLQLKVTPEVEEVPLMVTVFVTQLKVPVVDDPALGTVVLVVTLVTAVFTQPLFGSVTVTVYVPSTVASSFCDEEVKPPGPLQL